MTKHLVGLLGSFLLSVLLVAQVHAQTAAPGVKAGVVSDITGTATATAPDGTTRQLQAGSTLYSGDTIETAQGAMLRIAMEDQSRYTVIENTRLKFSAFKYQESAPAEDDSSLYLFRGALRFLTGLIGKRNPEKVAYQTPVATIGIRGTEGEVHYDSEHSTFHLCVLQDAVILRIGDKLVWDVPVGQGVTLSLDPKTGVLSMNVQCQCESGIPGVVSGQGPEGESPFYPFGNGGGAVASPS
jgi:hypothetical protein